MRRRYVWCDGEGWVERRGDVSARVQIIRDHVDEFQSMADGRPYDSKSEYRRSLKEHGLIELGNAHPDPQPYRGVPDWDRAIADAMASRGDL